MRPTLIAFEPDPEAIAEIRATKRRKAGKKREVSLLDHVRDLVLNEDGHLWMPMRLRVGGTDLLATPDGPWCPSPVVHAAATGMRCLRWVAACHRAELSLTVLTTLRFARQGEDVRVVNSATGAMGVASLVDLTAEWAAFAEEVRGYLLRELPELRTHYHYGEWLREGPSVLLRDV